MAETKAAETHKLKGTRPAGQNSRGLVTIQKVSGRAGLLTFAGFLHWHRFGALLARVLRHQRTSKLAIPVADLALGFLAGNLARAEKLAQVAHLRSDVILPVLLAIQRIGSQSTFTRCFQGFSSAGKNLATFRPLWRWCQERWPSRPGGYALETGGVTTIRLVVREPAERAWWRRLLEKTMSLIPNCNAVAQSP